MKVVLQWEPIPFIQGMEITGEVDKEGVERSILKLFEIPLNISKLFRCSGIGYSKEISFRRVKGVEKKKRTNKFL